MSSVLLIGGLIRAGWTEVWAERGHCLWKPVVQEKDSNQGNSIRNCNLRAHLERTSGKCRDQESPPAQNRDPEWGGVCLFQSLRDPTCSQRNETFFLWISMS